MSNRVTANRRKGVVAVFTVVVLTVLCGFAALTIDLGAAMSTRADLQDAADAAALSAAAALTMDEMMQVRLTSTSAITDVISFGSGLAVGNAHDNPTLGLTSTAVAGSDISFGWIDMTSASSGVDSSAGFESYNAVQVITRRTSQSANGPVAAMFSRIFGNNSMEIVTRATAAFDDRVAGFDSNGEPDVLPFTIDESSYHAQLAAGSDAYEYDSATGVFHGSDGVPEVNVFPSNNAPGNFGILSIGQNNLGIPGLRDHIDGGVPPMDFNSEIGSEEIIFYEGGAQQSYRVSGDTGIDTSLYPNIEARVGDLVAYFLHDHVTGTGSTSSYRITRIVFGRVMGVRLMGAPTHRGIWIQPATVNGGGVIIDAGAPSSGGNAGRLVLAR